MSILSGPFPASQSTYREYQRQRQLTLGDLLLENRIVFLQGEIHDGNANELVMKLLYLQSENRRKDLHFYFTTEEAKNYGLVDDILNKQQTEQQED